MSAELTKTFTRIENAVGILDFRSRGGGSLGGEYDAITDVELATMLVRDAAAVYAHFKDAAGVPSNG
jgi:hypothetical protein